MVNKRYKLYHVQLLDGLWLCHRDKHHLPRNENQDKVSLITLILTTTESCETSDSLDHLKFVYRLKKTETMQQFYSANNKSVFQPSSSLSSCSTTKKCFGNGWSSSRRLQHSFPLSHLTWLDSCVCVDQILYLWWSCFSIFQRVKLDILIFWWCSHFGSVFGYN